MWCTLNTIGCFYKSLQQFNMMSLWLPDSEGNKQTYRITIKKSSCYLMSWCIILDVCTHACNLHKTPTYWAYRKKKMQTCPYQWTSLISRGSVGMVRYDEIAEISHRPKLEQCLKSHTCALAVLQCTKRQGSILCKRWLPVSECMTTQCFCTFQTDPKSYKNLWESTHKNSHIPL